MATVKTEAGLKIAPLKTNATGSATDADEGFRRKLKLEHIVVSKNLIPLMDEEDVERIGGDVVSGYRRDRTSRTEWEKRNAEAMKLTLQVVEQKNFPWEKCSNVKFPLITVAALQFLARVSILTKGKTPVKCEVLGNDVDGDGYRLASRLGRHMSYQITEQDVGWMDDDEKTKFSCSILGSAFKKSYFDSTRGMNVSKFIPASNFVVDYNTKDLETCQRSTEVIPMTKNDIVERERAGVFSKMDNTPASHRLEVNLLVEARNESQGTRSADADGSISHMYEILEQHIWLDLDGDGYAEPYVVIVRLDTGQCLRIVARFFDEGDVIRANDSLIRVITQKKAEATTVKDKEAADRKIVELTQSKNNHVLRIVPPQFYTKYTFIPSPDGGFYDLGFGSLLGPLNESVNSIVNQLIDSGTMNTTAGGFLGRGVKMKGGTTTFNPFEWKPVDSTGDDLRKNIFPLPVREPSPVLLQLLQMLVSYGEKISGATDIMTGISPGQNTPAETSRNTIEQGMKIFSGIFARMHRGFTRELKILMNLNRLYLSSTAEWEALTQGPTAMLGEKDYYPGTVRVFPTIDVTMVSETQRQQNAQMVLQVSAQNPGFDRYLAAKEFLEAYSVPNIDMLLPDPKGPHAIQPPGNPKIDLEMKKLEQKNQQMQIDQQHWQIEMQQEALLDQAKIMKLQAEAALLVKEAAGVDMGHKIALLNAQIGAARSHEEGIMKALSLMQKSTELQQKAAEKGVASGGAKESGNAAASMAGVGAASGDPGAAQAAQGNPI